jgi:Protein of unknown function (DUF3349)
MSLMSSVVDFLRAGYPEGVPTQDYIPLLALLRRQLTDDEVLEVAQSVASDSDPDIAASVREAILEITRQPPLQSDLARVAARMASGGWPLASLDSLTASSAR